MLKSCEVHAVWAGKSIRAPLPFMEWSYWDPHLGIAISRVFCSLRCERLRALKPVEEDPRVKPANRSTNKYVHSLTKRWLSVQWRLVAVGQSRSRGNSGNNDAVEGSTGCTIIYKAGACIAVKPQTSPETRRSISFGILDGVKTWITGIKIPYEFGLHLWWALRGVIQRFPC